MSSDAQSISIPTRPVGVASRAVWVGGALLGLVAAGAAGALIMRSAQTAPATATASVAATTPTTVATAAQPVPLIAPAPQAPAAPTHNAAAAQAHTPNGTTHAALCASCGVVESVSAVQVKGPGTGLGVVAGGVLGGVVGHQVGGGNGKTAMTVLGAIGGGLAGNEVEKRARSETRFNVQVRMEDGSRRTFERGQAMAVGAHVVVEGTTLRVARSAPKSEEPQMLRTSAPTAGGNS